MDAGTVFVGDIVPSRVTLHRSASERSASLCDCSSVLRRSNVRSSASLRCRNCPRCLGFGEVVFEISGDARWPSMTRWGCGRHCPQRQAPIEGTVHLAANPCTNSGTMRP